MVKDPAWGLGGGEGRLLRVLQYQSFCHIGTEPIRLLIVASLWQDWGVLHLFIFLFPDIFPILYTHQSYNASTWR